MTITDQRLKLWNLGSPLRYKIAAACVVLMLCLLVPCLLLVHQKHKALDIHSLVSSHQVSLLAWAVCSHHRYAGLVLNLLKQQLMVI